MEWLEGLKPITWINYLGSRREGPTFAEDSRNLLKTSVVSGLNPSRSHDSVGIKACTELEHPTYINSG